MGEEEKNKKKGKKGNENKDEKKETSDDRTKLDSAGEKGDTSICVEKKIGEPEDYIKVGDEMQKIVKELDGLLAYCRDGQDEIHLAIGLHKAHKKGEVVKVVHFEKHEEKKAEKTN